MQHHSQHRILWLTQNYPPNTGGMAESCDRITRGLRRQNVEIDIWHFHPRLKRESQEQHIMGQYFGFPVAEDAAHTMNLMWNKIERQPPYTHIVAYGGILTLLSGPVFSQWLSTPLITMLRGNDFDTGIFSPRKSEILRNALTQSSAICCVSSDKQRRIQTMYPDKHVEWTANGLNTDNWQALPSNLKQAEQLRPPNKTVIGFFGHLKEKKGLAFFLECIQRSGYSEQIHLLLVGEIEPEIEQTLQNQDSISYSLEPFLERYSLIPHYLACDFIGLPSFYDGMPNVILEGAALNKPFIAASVAGMADCLTDEQHGHLFHPGDPQGCIQAIAKACKSTIDFTPNLQQLVSKFSAENEINRYLDILTQTHTATV